MEETKRLYTGNNLRNIEWQNCVICKKRFMRRTKRRVTSKLPPGVRMTGSKTCSPKCSREIKYYKHSLNLNNTKEVENAAN